MLELLLIVFDVNHMVDTALLVQTLEDMAHPLDQVLVLMALADLVNLPFQVLDNIQTQVSPAPEVQVGIMVDPTANNAVAKLNQHVHQVLMVQPVKQVQMG